MRLDPHQQLSLAGKARLAGEILVDYCRVRWMLGRRDLPRLVRALRGTSRAATGEGVDGAARDGRRLGHAVVRTIAPLPQGERCLLRSLVLMSVLARRGVAGDLVIAVQPGGDLPLDAHAWIEIDGRPVLAPAPDFGRLLTL